MVEWITSCDSDARKTNLPCPIELYLACTVPVCKVRSNPFTRICSLEREGGVLKSWCPVQRSSND